MDRKQAVYVAALAGAIGFIITFAYLGISSTRVFWYYPLEHRWEFELRPSGIAIDWYGRNLFAAVAWLACFGCAFGISRRSRPLAPSGYRLCAAGLAMAVLVATSIYVFQLMGRVPVPAELPSWYVPK